MSLHNEIEFEKDICEYLASHGWLYEDGSAERYNRELAMFPEDVFGWVQQTQPQVWESLQQKQGGSAENVLMDRIRKSLDQQGTLSLLRNGVDIVGLRKPIKLAEFKPAFNINPDILKRFQANRLRVVRQVRYSLHNENSLDLVLFLNGIPIATVELKTDFTQSVEDAVDQYRFDRLPKLKGKPAEPLLGFPSGALVHFAVSTQEVMMTTKLAGPNTFFLPFNRGNEGGKGNKPNPDGYSTAYLWEHVWQRDSLLDILGRYMIAERNERQQITTLVFPRYHQLDVTRALLANVSAKGAGQKYLIQHSAGSGKTMSIAWTAHFFGDLHNADNEKVFDTVIVVSDRNVIDGQLADQIKQFERNEGVVATIDNQSGSKSSKLAEALSGNKKIVVCTIQTFPFALETVTELAATQGKRFAVIADEAHSSQTGQAANKLKQVLSPEEQAELEDGGEISTEDMLAAQMSARAKDAGITYVAFTATPKAKTMELFGTRPNPDEPAGENNKPEPFHVYSMQQAIEEGFILDVLQNYTSYKTAFKLANSKSVVDDDEVEASVATSALMRWVKLHPHNITQKVQIIVEHYRDLVADLLDGNAKAMVAVSSRLEAVRWQIAINKYIRENNYPIATLVAFSGEIIDKESGPEPFKETSSQLNPDLKGRDIKEAFEGDYQILLVANKFQTGFDQPLLCAMYVDKRLSGIQAVQTLSRLNRSYPGKDTTYVLDFVNDPAEILESFQTYYTTAQLEDVADPYLIVDLRTKLDATRYYDEHEIERVVAVEMNPQARQQDLNAAITPVAQRLLNSYSAAKRAKAAAIDNHDEKTEKEEDEKIKALILFRSDLNSYIRAYKFLSQIFDYGNTDYEKRAIFFKYLVKLLKFGRERDEVDLSEVKLTHYALKNKGKAQLTLTPDDYPALTPLQKSGSRQIHEARKELLSNIIQKLNELYGEGVTDGDVVSYATGVWNKVLESDLLVKQAANNTEEQFNNSPDLEKELLSAVMENMDTQQTLSAETLNSVEKLNGLLTILLDMGLYKTLRRKDQQSRNVEPRQILSLDELLAEKETKHVEFKQTARTPLDNNVPEKIINDGIIKTVAAFMNSGGGTLAIGIDDDGNIVGLEPDLVKFKGDQLDQYQNWLTTLLMNNIGPAETGACVNFRLEKRDGKGICLVDVQHSMTPIYSQTSKGKHCFFVRMNNTTRMLEGPDIQKYIESTWQT